jgi:hypothetical protein
MPPVSTSNPVSTSTSVQASAISSTSSANIPLPSTSGNRATQSQNQKKKQRTGEYQAPFKVDRSSASKDAWDAYFRDQQAQGVTYDESDASLPSQPSSTALLPRAMTSDVGFARPPSNFRVLNLQAQHMIIHDSSSNQLVEASIPSIDFSQSAALQNILCPQVPARRNSPPRAREDSPPRCSRLRSR